MVEIIHIRTKTGPRIPVTPYYRQKEIEPTTELCKKFTYWLEHSVPGDRFCYYNGDHITGQNVGRIAYRAYEQGKIMLFQRRTAYGFSYWAQRKRQCD